MAFPPINLTFTSYGWLNRLEQRLARRVSAQVWLAAILLVAAAFRFTGLNWDENQHLHPDERFLTMVETAIRWPDSLTQYFDTARNPLSPYNHNFGLYVYGTLPLFLVKRVGMLLNQTGYDQIHLIGRAMSALFDLGTIWLVYLLGRRLYGDSVGLLAAALLSLSAFTIQQSHFFTVDTFANVFIVATAYVAVRVAENGRRWDYVVLGLMLGAAVACKISAYTLGILAVLAAGIYVYRVYRQDPRRLGQACERSAERLVLAAIVSLLVFRVLQPIAFEGPSFFNFTPNSHWLGNMAEVGGMLTGERDFPPGHQWTDRQAFWFPWSNMVVWGMGVPFGVVAWIGWGYAAWELVRRRKLEHLLPVAYVGLVFAYQGFQWVKTMRYFLALYPFLALLAGYFLVRTWAWATARANGNSASATDSDGAVRRTRLNPGPLAAGLIALVVGGTFLYALAFTSIYTRPHSRVEASRWIYEHVPRNATIANEHWDDPLPLRIDGQDGFANLYKGVMLDNYDEDSPRKLSQLVERLAQSDYLVLSSNRLYDSIPRLPMRFPMTTRYYTLLFAGRLGFEKVAEFTSYPQLLGVQLPDQGAEEAWSVYDHPKVTIFQKTAEFEAGRVHSLLEEGINWDGVLRLRANQVSSARSGLMLSPADQERYAQSGTWSELFDRRSWANRLPVAHWWLVLQVIGLLAFPLTFAACSNLTDRGYGLSKALGLLLVGWAAWWLASVRLMQFDLPAIVIPLAALGLVSAAIAYQQRDAMLRFLRDNVRLILIEEALFTLFFAAGLAIRWGNPDLWHPVMGGEKPMDFAYLNAVIKSAYFPPYDPWFAGGYINYYYFGFVLVAVLVKLSGIIPSVAYNLAVPTLFAFTGVGAFVVTLNLYEALRRGSANASRSAYLRPSVVAGLWGAGFVAVIGNLGEVQLLIGGLQELSAVNFPTTIPGLLGLVKVLDGARELLLGGRSLPFRTEWPYWNATRVIPHPSNEAVPITEFPFFTFLYGDLHAHMMALPYTLVALALVVSLIRAHRSDAAAREEASTMERAHDSVTVTRLLKPALHLGWAELAELLTLVALALVIGALWPMNTWDFPTYALLVGVALACRALGGPINSRAVIGVAWRWLLVVGLGYLLFAPFHRYFAGAYSSVELWKGSRTPLDAFLVIHGLFLFLIVSYLVYAMLHERDGSSVTRLLRVSARSWHRLGRLADLYSRLANPSLWHSLAMWLLGLAVVASITLIIVQQPALALVLLLAALSAALLLSPRAHPAQRFLLCLVGLGLVLTLAVEVVVLKGDVSRMNTVFKFYLQVWVMWAVATAVLLCLADTRGDSSTGRSRWTAPWRVMFGLLLSAGLLYPIYATQARVNDRFDASVGPTLDGAAFMSRAVYNDRNQRIVLDWDRQAIEWLQDNVAGSPVILEANTPLYHWGSRISIYTGLPTVIGWDWHQKQQRAVLPGETIDRRLNDVKEMYTNLSPEATRQLLQRYGVRYVYVGRLERVYYGDVVDKFERDVGRYWETVYQNPEVTIYAVR